MKNFKVYVIWVLLVLLPLARADILINSQDWRDAYLGLLYGKLSGEEAHYLLNLGETDLLLKSIDKERHHEVFENLKSPVIKNLKGFMMNYEFSFISETLYTDYKDLQFLLYNKVKNNVKGFVIIKPDFGYDAISVFPLAVNEKKWVFFYDTETERRILDILNTNPEKSVIFYGEYFLQPWKKIKNPYEIIYGTGKERNKEVVKRVWKEVNGWVVLTSGDYLEKGSLESSKPILLTKATPKEIAEFLKALGVKFVEVIGPENVDFGYRVREAANKTIGVLAKIGRTFTGDPELRGKLYTLPVKPVDKEIHDLRIEKILWNENVVLIVFKNYGNVRENFRIDAARFIGTQAYAFSDSSTHVIYPGETISIPFEGNFSNLNGAEILVRYGENFELRTRNETTNSFYFGVSYYHFPEVEKPEVTGVFYDDSLEKLWVRFSNPKGKEIWVRVEFQNFTFLNKSIVLSSKTVKLTGKEGFIPIGIYLDKDDLTKNKNVTLLVFYGPSKELLTRYYVFEQKKEIKIKRINEIFLLFIVLIITIIISISIFLFKRGILDFRILKNLYVRRK